MNPLVSSCFHAQGEQELVLADVADSCNDEDAECEGFRTFQNHSIQ